MHGGNLSHSGIPATGARRARAATLRPCDAKCSSTTASTSSTRWRPGRCSRASPTCATTSTRRWSPSTARPAVRAAHGTLVTPHRALLRRPSTSSLVPGGGWNDRSEDGAWAQAQRGALPRAIARAPRARAPWWPRCAPARCSWPPPASLDGRHAITHHGAIDDLEAAGAHVVAGARGRRRRPRHRRRRHLGPRPRAAPRRALLRRRRRAGRRARARVRAPRDGVARERPFEPCLTR